MRAIRTATITATVAALGATTLGVLQLTSASAEDPAPRAAGVATGNFTDPLQNPYFPLRPGTAFHYRGTDDGEHLHERVAVTSRVRHIQGVATTVVRDVLRRSDGSVAEKTFDYYAPDNEGTVWYFGERTATYDEHGHVESREGSWLAGVDGAQAGVIMPADPRPTDAYRQEWYPGQAEDQAWIVQRNASTKVPFGKLHHVVRTFEWSRLEKRVVSLKLYAPGLGIVRERDMSGGSESFVLVSVTRPR